MCEAASPLQPIQPAPQQPKAHPPTHLEGRAHKLELLHDAQRGIQLQHHARGGNAPAALPTAQLLHRQHACRRAEEASKKQSSEAHSG